MKNSFQIILENAEAEVKTMAVWRSLPLKDREKALKLLLGDDWQSVDIQSDHREVSKLG